MINSTQENLVLRYRYPEFVFESFEYYRNADGIKADYVYKLGEHTFKPSVEIPTSDIRNEEIDDNFLNYLFFNFGVINAMHYYKLAIPQVFRINAGYLDEAQKSFFQKIFYGELSEFLYNNNIQIPFDHFMTIETVEKPEEERPIFDFKTKLDGNLIPVGGNKNSVITLETLQPMHDKNYCFLYHYGHDDANIAATDCIKEAGYGLEKVLDFNLDLDPQIFTLAQEGFYNGHVASSSCFAFAAYILAYLNKLENIILSNNAFDGNNHQYSKSFGFEQDFQTYISTYFTPGVKYFSLLRCINDYRIYQKFIKYPLYLKAFGGCQNHTEEKRWCGHCARCLYNYLMLYPLVDHDKLKEVFGSNLLDDQRLSATFVNLVNAGSSNPFDFVGTKEEIVYSLQLALNQIQEGEKIPFLLQYFRDYLNTFTLQYDITRFYNAQHHIPQEYLALILQSWYNKTKHNPKGKN